MDSAQNLLQFIQFLNHKHRSRKGATGAKRKGDTLTNRAQSAGATPLGRVVQSMAEVPCDGEDVELEGEEIRPILDLIFGGAASRSDLTEG